MKPKLVQTKAKEQRFDQSPLYILGPRLFCSLARGKIPPMASPTGGSPLEPVPLVPAAVKPIGIVCKSHGAQHAGEDTEESAEEQSGKALPGTWHICAVWLTGGAIGGVWHEVRTHSAFAVGELCVRCREEAEDLSHILLCCPHWHKERGRVELPADEDNTPACVKLHGLDPAPRVPAVITHEPALVNRAGVGTVWSGGSIRHSSDPQHKRCRVSYYSDTQERVWQLWLPLPGLKQAAYRAEMLAVVRALEDCQPHKPCQGCQRLSGSGQGGPGFTNRTENTQGQKPGSRETSP
eukprot:2036917-Amphidinium_carterae.1